MLRRRRTFSSSVVDQTRPSSDVHEWVLGLPWVVERPTDGTRPDVRLFAVDCEPLQRRQLWLVTGLTLAHDGRVGIAVVMPAAAVRSSNARGWVTHPATPLPNGHVLVTLQHEFTAAPAEIEALVLGAYNYAMS
jgi:hypothetical protein